MGTFDDNDTIEGYFKIVVKSCKVSSLRDKFQSEYDSALKFTLLEINWNN